MHSPPPLVRISTTYMLLQGLDPRKRNYHQWKASRLQLQVSADDDSVAMANGV